MKKHQNGFAALEIMIAVVVIGLLGVAGWLVFNRQTGSPNDSAQTSQETSSNEENQTNTDKTDPNEGYVVLDEWGLRFKAPSGIDDVEYVIIGDTVAFYAKPADSSVQYRASYSTFDENDNPTYALGTLYRKTEPQVTNTALDLTTEGKKLGDYYYFTGWAFSSLATGRGCIGLFGNGEQD